MKMKKIGAVLAIGCLAAALALAGCSGSSGSASSGSSDSKSDSGSAYKLQSAGTLTIATSPDFPPFENMENGEYVGLDIEVGKAVAKKLGLEPKFVSLQFDAILPAISSSTQADIGISGFTVDPERAKQVDFTNSYYTDDLSIAVMNSSAVTKETVDADLNSAGVSIAVQSGTTGETYVQEHYPDARVVAYGNSNDCFAAMQAGQVNAVCTNYAVVNKMLADAYSDAKVVKSIATGEEYAIAVSQDNKALTEDINKALKELAADGTIDNLLKQYM